ncbi:MAG: ribosome biogenesis GTPase Der [Legionellales bacterium]|nr:ribosome biogenesis GTPase Der [Legionellales bacterium]
MIPVVAIVGRPNVGKSTLFNRLTGTWDALVADQPGVTRDRQYGEGKIGDKPFIVIDTGGLAGEEFGIQGLTEKQVKLALQEADRVLFVLDAKSGLTADDKRIARELRQLNKPIFVAVNKVDGSDKDMVLADFYQLGFEEVLPLSATQGRGIPHLVDTLLEGVVIEPDELPADVDAGIKVAIIGRPNVGKSTLVNRILGDNRVITSDEAGTTRTCIYVPFVRQEQHYTLIDTAGVRRRGNVIEAVEKFSVIKTLQAIEACHVAVLVVSAQDNITEQDLRLLDFILEAGKAIVIAVNKWDGLDDYERSRVRVELDRRITFVDFARIHFISALHGSGVGELYDSIKEAYDSAMVPLHSSELTRILEQAVTDYQPPMSRGRRIKLRFAHPGGHNPPVIVIHGNQTEKLPDSYRRYLMKYFREALHITGSPVKLIFKTGENPFADKKNKLTPHQLKKRQRLKSLHKKR